MKPSSMLYRFCYCLARPVLGFLYWCFVQGKKNIPDTPVLVCANHSSLLDPFLLAFAFGIKRNVHMIGKVELFRIPIISPIILKLGMISVDRGIMDVKTVKKTLGFLNNGGRVAIFPEGTRTSEDNAVAAKSGAIKLAEHAGVPILPVFIPRKKRIFKKFTVAIGEPFHIEKQKEKRVQEDYIKLSEIMMDKIYSLNPETAQARAPKPVIRKTWKSN